MCLQHHPLSYYWKGKPLVTQPWTFYLADLLFRLWRIQVSFEHYDSIFPLHFRHSTDPLIQSHLHYAPNRISEHFNHTLVVSLPSKSFWFERRYCRGFGQHFSWRFYERRTVRSALPSSSSRRRRSGEANYFPIPSLRCILTCLWFHSSSPCTSSL